MKGLSQRSQFVATQLPLTDTVVDFWRMVMDYNYSIIVYLHKPNDKQVSHKKEVCLICALWVIGRTKYD